MQVDHSSKGLRRLLAVLVAGFGLNDDVSLIEGYLMRNLSLHGGPQISSIVNGELFCKCL